eukprot:4332137-Pyramimonas_sp.AAC.1
MFCSEGNYPLPPTGGPGGPQRVSPRRGGAGVPGEPRGYDLLVALKMDHPACFVGMFQIMCGAPEAVKGCRRGQSGEMCPLGGHEWAVQRSKCPRSTTTFARGGTLASYWAQSHLVSRARSLPLLAQEDP